jgi:Domain of unknown function (DUF4166)
MGRSAIVIGECFSNGHLHGRPLPALRRRHRPPRSLRQILGPAAWSRLPEAVRVRFADDAHRVDYVGEFETVRASLLGRIIAWTCQIIGTPVVPHTGSHVPAIVHVGPRRGEGVEWCREYHWSDRPACLVRSTKVIRDDGILVEELPSGLRMTLDVYEQAGTLHFVSRAYYFEVGIPGVRHRARIGLPLWLSPGTTHVEHIDGADGWFRFTMTITHPFFGEMFYQTGRFHALGD